MINAKHIYTGSNIGCNVQYMYKWTDLYTIGIKFGPVKQGKKRQVVGGCLNE